MTATTLATACAALLAILPATAAADIHKCTDADGLVTFTDSPSRKFKSCTLLYRDPSPAPAAPPAGAARPAPGASSAGQGATPAAQRPRSELSTTRANPGPENFPRVDRGEQRERDLKARQIVERELASEQRLLEDARRQISSLGATAGDKSDPRLREWQNAASRHERNITEIQRQLSLMK